jgi:hypothetical protein
VHCSVEDPARTQDPPLRILRGRRHRRERSRTWRRKRTRPRYFRRSRSRSKLASLGRAGCGAHRFKELFGYEVLNAQRRERIEQLIAEADIEVRPSLEEAKRDNRLVMSMPVEVPVPETRPDPALTPEWFGPHGERAY